MISKLVPHLALLVLAAAARLHAQDVPDWQTAAGGKMAFEVASVKPSTGAFQPPNMPLNTGNRSAPTGNYFRADFPLWTYIQFAYKIWPTDDQSREMLAHLPKWVTTDRYTIDARAASANPTKDQMRLMVQALLADRFHLAAHFETRELPVYVLTVVKPGKLGPKLIAHADGLPCDPAASPATPPAKGVPAFPPVCDSPALLRKSNGALMLAGYRNANTELLAGTLSSIVLDRPVIDQTGLSGNFDFTVEWAPDSNAAPPSDSPAAGSNPPGPSALEALREQLGLKVESAKGPVRILVIDKVERPSAN